MFDSPEFDTIGGHGSLIKDSAAYGLAGRKNALGIPLGAMPDGILVNAFRKVLRETGELQKGTSTWSGSSAGSRESQETF